MQHLRARPVRVAHVLGLDGERAAGQFHAGRGLDDLDRQVEHGQDLAPTRDRGLRLGVDLGQVGEHVQEDVGEEQERGDLPEREAPGGAVGGAEHDHHGERHRVEDRRHGPERRGPEVRHDLGAVALVDRVLHLAVGLLLQAVGAHDRRAHHRLGDLREHLPDARARGVVRRGELRLHRADHQQERDHEQHHRQRELPGVDQHQGQGPQHLRERDEPGDARPLHELLQRVDVRGHPRHEHAALLLGLLGDRESVDVLERAHAQHHQRLLGGAHEAACGRTRGDEREEHQDERERADRVDVGRAEPAREPVVEDFLDEDGRDEGRHRHPERDDHREPEPALELRALAHAPAEHRPGAAELVGDGEVVVLAEGLELGGRAHRSPRS